MEQFHTVSQRSLRQLCFVSIAALWLWCGVSNAQAIVHYKDRQITPVNHPHPPKPVQEVVQQAHRQDRKITPLIYPHPPKPTIDLESCPQWLKDYTVWHKQNKGKSGTKYFIWQCHGGCQGLGDRFRGLMFGLRMAVGSKRVMLVDWSDPFDLQIAFEPNLMDWRHKDFTNPDTGELVELDMEHTGGLWMPAMDPPEEFRNGSNWLYNQEQVFTFISNQFSDSQCDLLPPVSNDIHSKDLPCMFHYMFKPSTRLKDDVEAAVVSLYGTVDAQYTAAHLRLGRLIGETNPEDRFGQDSTLWGQDAAQECGANITREDIGVEPLHNPVLLISDNYMVRYMVGHNYLKGVTGPEIFHVAHIDFGEEKAFEKHWPTFIDLGLMAYAKCFLRAPSGFSDVARWWGHHDCVFEMRECVNNFKRAITPQDRWGEVGLRRRRMWERIMHSRDFRAPMP